MNGQMVAPPAGRMRTAPAAARGDVRAAPNYSLGIPPLDGPLSPVRAGSNLLITGPPLCGADTFVYNILHEGLARGEAAILVTTALGGEDCLEELRRHGVDPENLPGPLGVVDCLSQAIGLNIGDTERIKRVSSPVNLTSIAVAATGFLQEFWRQHGARKMRLAVHSLSTMLMYSDVRTVFRFLHVFAGRMKSARGLGIYVVEGQSFDETVLLSLMQLADEVIELRMEEDRRLTRAVGARRTTPWIPYRIDAGRILPGPAGAPPAPRGR